MKHISLFSGIGGFDLASEWMGWQNVASCEINPFGNKVLEYYWPNAYHHDDIKTLTYEKLNQELTTRFGADWHSDDIILTGGFPCQPYSSAGKRLGKEDERHLWPEMCRVIREVKPTWIVGENVLGLVNWSGGLVFEEVQADLEAEGYEVQPFVLPACAVNAPHRRDRVWFVAYSKSAGKYRKLGNDTGQEKKNWSCNDEFDSSSSGNAKNTLCSRCLQRKTDKKGAKNGEQRHLGSRNSKRIYRTKMAGYSADTSSCGRRQVGRFGKSGQLDQTSKVGNWENFPTQSPVCTGDDGLSSKLDGITFPKWRNESIKSAGNAIVPQVVYQIFKAIEEYEQNRNNGQDGEAAH